MCLQDFLPVDGGSGDVTFVPPVGTLADKIIFKFFPSINEQPTVSDVFVIACLHPLGKICIFTLKTSIL